MWENQSVRSARVDIEDAGSGNRLAKISASAALRLGCAQALPSGCLESKRRAEILSATASRLAASVRSRCLPPPET